NAGQEFSGEEGEEEEEEEEMVEEEGRDNGRGEDGDDGGGSPGGASSHEQGAEEDMKPPTGSSEGEGRRDGQQEDKGQRKGEGKEGEKDGEEDDALAADATLSKMKLSTNFGAPLGAAGVGGEEGGSGGGSPATPVGLGLRSREGMGSNGKVNGVAFSPTPATPQNRRTDMMDSTALSSLITSTASGSDGNNLIELARIHQRIVDLEAKAEQVSSMHRQLQKEQDRTRRAEAAMQELSHELDALRRENAHLRMELDGWHHREGHAQMMAAAHHHHHHHHHQHQQQLHMQQQQQQQQHSAAPAPAAGEAMEAGPAAGKEGEVVGTEGEKCEGKERQSGEGKEAHLVAAELLVEAAAAEKDKRVRSDSITKGAELLGGFKKQRVESPGLSISTEGREGVGDGGEKEGSGVATVQKEADKEGAKAVEKKEIHTGVYGEGYETPRNTIKQSPIAL
ncbi:hypothetical protein Naga_100019g1, partial [Nannochloropsis gaditana]